MVTEQAKEWTDLITRQMKEDATLNSEQLSGQLDMLKAAGEALQLAQIKTLETHFEKQVHLVLIYQYLSVFGSSLVEHLLSDFKIKNTILKSKKF